MMTVRFTDFYPDIPDKERYVRGLDYILYVFDLEFGEAFELVEQLKINRSSVAVCTPSNLLDFFIFNGA